MAVSKGKRKKHVLIQRSELLHKKNWIGLNLYLENWNVKVFCIPTAGTATHTEAKLPSCELHVLRLWRKETYKEYKIAMNCWKKIPFISKQDSFKTTLQEQTPETVLKNYVNCTTQGCQGTLYHPSPECALWSLVFQWSQGAQIMIKDFHLWPWDVKSPVHSYDLRRTNCKVIITGASFKGSHPQW